MLLPTWWPEMLYLVDTHISDDDPSPRHVATTTVNLDSHWDSSILTPVRLFHHTSQLLQLMLFPLSLEKQSRAWQKYLDLLLPFLPWEHEHNSHHLTLKLQSQPFSISITWSSPTEDKVFSTSTCCCYYYFLHYNCSCCQLWQSHVSSILGDISISLFNLMEKNENKKKICKTI